MYIALLYKHFLIFNKNVKINNNATLYFWNSIVCGFNIYNLIIKIGSNCKAKIISHIYGCNYIQVSSIFFVFFVRNCNIRYVFYPFLKVSLFSYWYNIIYFLKCSLACLIYWVFFPKPCRNNLRIHVPASICCLFITMTMLTWLLISLCQFWCQGLPIVKLITTFIFWSLFGFKCSGLGFKWSYAIVLACLSVN